MFIYRTQVHLKNTDATGVLYFPEQLTFAMQTFEQFLKARGFSLKKLLDSSYLLPVVHVKANYSAPLMIGDPLEITLKLSSIGSSSLTLHYTLYDPERKLQVGDVEVVHVAVDKNTRASVPIPDFLRKILMEKGFQANVQSRV